MGYLEEHGWIAWIIIGGLAGMIAKFLMPGKDPGGCIVTVLHEGMPDAVPPADNELGTRMALAKLAQLIESGGG